jgi:mannose-6-phosphate isomerase-like protein (cupin superfamily)
MGIYEPGAYSDLSEDQIFGKLTCEGHRPHRAIERPGAVYQTHKNTYDLVLAFLRGSADILVGDRMYHCVPGDKLNIPGSTPHSGVVGTQGVVYLMTQVVNCAD